MKYISLNKKLLKISIIIILIASLFCNYYNFTKNIELSNKYRSLMCMANHIDDNNLISYVSSIDISQNKNIEIFDIKKGEVVKKIESNENIQKEVSNILKQITGVYVKAKPFPNEGYIIRIPLSPPQKVENIWLKNDDINSVVQVFILFPIDEDPFLLILDEKYRPFFYNFDRDISILLNELNQ